MKRINCHTADCTCCAKGCKSKTTILGKEMIVCSAFKKQHKIIDARDCGLFICNKKNNNHILCRNCNQK